MDDKIKSSIEQIVTALKAAGAHEVYLFGSAAKATMNEASDVDIAVSGLPPEIFFRVLGLIEDILRRPIDLIDLDDRTPFTEYLRTEGELQRVG